MMYVDLSTQELNIVSRVYLLTKYGKAKAKDAELTHNDLAEMNAAVLSAGGAGDVPTGRAILVDNKYVREYRSWTVEETVRERERQARTYLEATDFKALNGTLTPEQSQTRAAARAILDGSFQEPESDLIVT